jgi:alginate O-acetyltransferase complex protein AlgI
MHDEKPQKNIIDFGAYVAMFPQLIAGPIVQYQTVAKELRERKETLDDFALGIKYFVFGLGKKVLLANNVGLVWKTIKTLEGPDMSVVLAWLGIICFALQIYYDFSGYSDMAIGLGKMLGFNFPINFNYPYMSKSVTEFFRRWHISLGKWFRDYVYIPLGGNRHGIIKQIRNIMIVWFLTGFWHGAAYNFVLWGLYFGILLVIEKTFLLDVLNKIPRIFSHLYTLFVVLIGWVLFEFETVGGIFNYLKNMFGIGCDFVNDYSVYMIINNLLLVLIASFGAIDLPKKWALKISDRVKNSNVLSIVLENIPLVVVLLMSVFYIVAGSYNPFLYFRF